MDKSLTHSTPFQEGRILLFDKPLSWTSFQLVKKIKYLTRAKTGHAGTLDPLATGLMILCTGKFTKKIQDLQGLPKEYTGSIRLGVTTPSYDAETEEENHTSINHITQQQIFETATSFLGDQMQKPPMFSAIKIKGKKLYDLARKGEEIKRPDRPIHIAEFEVTSIQDREVFFRISCSKGTYIRSIAHDFGQKLGVGGYLTSLRRTKIGDYSLEDAWTIEDFEKKVKQDHESL